MFYIKHTHTLEFQSFCRSYFGLLQKGMIESRMRRFSYLLCFVHAKTLVKMLCYTSSLNPPNTKQ